MVAIRSGDAGRSIRLSGSPSNTTVYYHSSRDGVESADGYPSGGSIESIAEPRGADLIAKAIPFARESLEQALEQFVDQLDDLDLGLLGTRGPAPIVMFSVAAITTAASAELARRYVQRKNTLGRAILAVETSGRQLTLGFPELPGSWSERRS